MNGGFSDWTVWGACSKTCGTGSKVRTRECNNPAPQNGGSDCAGDKSETQACKVKDCEGRWISTRFFRVIIYIYFDVLFMLSGFTEI